MGIRNPSKQYPQRGSVSVQMLVLLVPVFFGFMGFAIDLAQLYLMRSELQAAANSAAMAAASKLIGTDASIDAATATAKLTYETGSGYGNKYGYGGMALGGTTGNLTSEVVDPAYFSALADAIATTDAGGGDAGGATAKYAKVSIKGDAPLVFWNFLSIVSEPKVSLNVQAVAGLSAPVCTVCANEPFAIAAVDASDPVDFGYILDQRYTFAYSCSGGGGGGGRTINSYPLVNYMLLDRYNTNLTILADEQDQAFRIGANGMPPAVGGQWTDTLTYSCIKLTTDGAGESPWGTANGTPLSMTCGNPATTVTSVLCGLALRFDTTQSTACSSTNIPDLDTMMPAYSQDTDLTDLDTYASYTGNGRRLITVPVVDALNSAGGMVVLGFRQFIVQPRTDLTLTTIDPSDSNGRFVATYIGSVAPVRQGFLGGCPQQSNGPGKVVLHQ